jgi:hypothetical protein
VSVVCCQVEDSVTGQYIAQRSLTDCVCVNHCDKVQQQPSAPTMSRQKEVKLRKKRKKELLIQIQLTSCHLKINIRGVNSILLLYFQHTCKSEKQITPTITLCVPDFILISFRQICAINTACYSKN